MGMMCWLTLLLWILLVLSSFDKVTGTDSYAVVSVDANSTSGTPGGIYFYDWDVDEITTPRFVGFASADIRITSMDVNVADNVVYFFEFTTRCIYRLQDFTSLTTVLTTVHCGVSSSVFTSITYDWISGNIYWTDGFFNWIAVQSVRTADNTTFRVIVQDNIEKPRAIAVDPVAGFIFWFDISESGFRIERAMLDGTNRTAIVSDVVLTVPDIETDVVDQRLYWTDPERYSVESSKYDGTDRKILYREFKIRFRSIAIDTNQICTTFYDKKFWVCFDKSTQGISFIRQDEFLYNYPVDLSIFKYETKPTVTDNCLSTGCEHFCINKPSGATCVCKEGYSLLSNGTCKANYQLYPKGILVSTATKICMLDFSTMANHTKPLLCLKSTVTGCSFITADVAKQVVYYADSVSNYLKGYDTVKNTIESLTFASDVSGLAFDWIDENLYWTESTGKVKVLSVSTRSVVDIAQASSPPSLLTIDPHTRNLFWIEGSAGFTMTIISKSISGNSSPVILVQASPPAFIRGIYVDVEDARLFYMESDKLISVKQNGTDEILHYYNINAPDHLVMYKRYAVWWDPLTSELKSVALQHNSLQRTKLSTITESVTALAIYDLGTQRTSRGPCQILNGGCEQICIAPSGAVRNVTCECSFGFVRQSDQKSCANVPLKTNFLLVPDISHIRIYQVSTIDSEIRALDVNVVERPFCAIYDSKSSYMYWTDINDGYIMRSTLEGRDTSILFVTGSESYPAELVIDDSTGNLYFTISGIEGTLYPGRICVMQPSTGSWKILKDNLARARSLVLYPSKGIMFYLNRHVNGSDIVRADMDGENSRTIVFSNIINDIAIDFTTNRLYWTLNEEGINYSDFNGYGKTTLIAETFMESIQIAGNFLYYTNERIHRIMKYNLHTDMTEPFMTTTVEFGIILDMHIYPGQIQPVHPTCSRNNGGCSDFCLPKMTTTTTFCACPNGIALKPDDPYTCSGVTRCSAFVLNGNLDHECGRSPSDTCTVQCTKGYHNVTSPDITCQPDGQWSEDITTICQASECSRVIPNGQLSTGCTGRIGDICSYSCNTNYVQNPTYSPPLTCMSTAEWYPPTNQLCIAEVPTCSTFIQNGLLPTTCLGNIGESCSYACNSGYIQNTQYSATLVCLQTGEWNQPKDDLCKIPDAPSNENAMYIGAGLGALVVVALAVVLLVFCFMKRRNVHANRPTPAEPNVYYTAPTSQAVGGVVYPVLYNTPLSQQESLPKKNIPMPTPPAYTQRDENLYDTIPNETEGTIAMGQPTYNDPAHPYEEPTTYKPSGPLCTEQSDDHDYLTLLKQTQ